MAINIEIIKVEVEPKGKYQVASVTYKDDKGKPDMKKIVSFDKDSKSVYDVLKTAQPGDTYSVTSEKVGDFWKWTAIGGAGKSTGGATGSGVVSKSVPAPRSNYETPEERAARQVYIVRQSSVSSAVELLKDPKKTPAADEVVAVAKVFEEYVFSDGKADPVSGYFNEAELKEPDIK